MRRRVEIDRTGGDVKGMTGFWDKLRGKGASPADGAVAAMGALFDGYPPNPPRHAGDPRKLTDTQRDENFAQFLEQREQRLGIIGRFLRGKGVDPAPMLTPVGDGGVVAARAIDGWLDQALPKRPFSPVAGDETPNPPTHAFRASERSGSDIYYSFLADLGLLEGEAVRLRDPRFDWAINRLPELSEMGSYQRICLMKPGSADWAPTVFELDEHMLAICHPKMAPRGNNSGHWFGELLQGAIDGAFDPK